MPPDFTEGSLSRAPSNHAQPRGFRLRRARIINSLSRRGIIAVAGFIALYLISSNIMAYFHGRIRFEPQVQTNQALWLDDPLFNGRLHSRIASYVSGVMHSAATGTLDPLKLHEEFGKIDNGIIEFSWRESLVRKMLGISDSEQAHIVVDTIIVPLIECVNQLKNQIPSVNDSGGMRYYAMTLYGMRNLGVRIRSGGDTEIYEEDFRRARDRVYADFATCRQIQAGIGKYIENTFGGLHFRAFSETVDGSIRSGRLMRIFDDMLQRLSDAQSTGYNYNLKNYHHNTKSIEEHGRGMSEYANRLFFQKCPQYTISFGDREDRLPSLARSEACDDLTVELMNGFRRYSEQQMVSIGKMNNGQENEKMMSVDELLLKVGFATILVLASNIGILRMNFDFLASLTQR